MIKEVRLPEVSENVESGEIAKVLVRIGDWVDADQSLIELETDKAVVEVPSPFAGRVVEILAEAGQTIKIGQAFLKLDTEAAEARDEQPKPAQVEPKPAAAERAAAETPPPAAPVEVKPAPSSLLPPAAASPSVRRLARELGIDVNRIQGAGPNQRITEADVKLAAKQAVESSAGAAATALSVRPVPDLSRWGEIERMPMSRVRQITADTLTHSWTNVPHVFQFDKADITDLEAFRKQFGAKVEKAGGKLTVTSMLVKVLATALRRFPKFNAAIDPAEKTIIYRKYINIGVAVDTDRGLLVPVLRDADSKNITELSVELTELSDKCRTNKITADELQGGGFTISNLGGIGGTSFTPIIYWPQVAILGVDRAMMEPVFRGGEFIPRLMLPLTLSYDHRLIDGADAARFVSWLTESLSNPLRMLLD